MVEQAEPKQMSQLAVAGPAVALALVLAACGGSSGSTTPTPLPTKIDTDYTGGLMLARISHQRPTRRH